MTLRLNGSTSGYTEIDAPAVAGSNTLVLPTGNGTNGQVLTTNGSGALSWATVTSSKILQVVQTAKTDTFTTTSTSYVDITGFSVSITPSSAASKILVIVNLAGNSINALGGAPILLRDSTIINQANSAGSRGRGSISGGLFTGDGSGDTLMVFNVNSTYLDSPATTSTVTYKVQVKNVDQTVYINRSQDDADSADRLRSVSTITVMEVAP